MSPRRKPTDLHSEWLALLDIDEPFYTPPALAEAFGPAVPKTPKPVREQVLDRVEQAEADDYDERLTWLRWLLTDGLGFDATRNLITFEPDERHTHTFTAHTGPVTLNPWAVAHNPGKPDEPRLLVMAQPGRSIGIDVDGYQPDRRHNDDGWPATPVQRATRLCRALDCRLALVTNGTKLTLVTVAEGVVGHGTWHTGLFQSEPVHLDSLRALLNANRFYGAADDQTPEALLDTSIARQQDLTGDLGDQIRRAAELLVGALSRADRRHDRRLLTDISGRQVYEAAVTVLMRTVFLLTAEERGLLPAANSIYQRDYAIGTLRERLEEGLRSGRASSQRRSHGWHRLLALSRAVHAGVAHDQLRLPGYGGRLFDPDRFPFLEGCLADGSQVDADLVDDLTLSEILAAIQVVDGRPISFRALEVEQIGHVYESLLDHSAVKADTPVVGLVGAARGLEPEIPLAELEEARLAGDEKLIETLDELTGKKGAWLRERLDAPLDDRVERTLRAVCGNDIDLHERVRPFGNLLRLDLRDLPLVFLPGDTYVTETSAKRDSGTAYTTRELAEEIAKHALDPLIYAPGPQDTADSNDWKLRRSEDILDLKVCDPAVGSGAIIVAAVRYLADALVRAWLAEGWITDADLVAGEATGQLDVTVRARREVVARCIYAVDRDPMAVDMAKMSLWLVTMAKDHPFTFLDHAIKCGDSLLGITDLDQLTWLHLDPRQGRKIHRQAVIPTELAVAAEQPSLYQVEPEQQSLDYGHFSSTLGRLIATARNARDRLRQVPDTDLDAEATKAAMLAEADDAVDRLRVVADAVVAAALATATERASAYDDRLTQIAPHVGQLADDTAPSDVRQAARGALQQRTASWKEGGNPSADLPRGFLHWPLEFPEVMAGGRFSALVGNPPFLGGKRISGPLGRDYREFIVRHIADDRRGNSDLVGYFLLRAANLTKTFGSLATNTVSQGDTREVALDNLAGHGVFYRAYASSKWPGEGSLFIAKLWWTSGHWSTQSVIDDVPVDRIDTDLYPDLGGSGRPLRLPMQSAIASQGVTAVGMAFVLEADEAARLLEQDRRASEVVFPFVSGADVNNSPQHASNRWIINFGDRSLPKAAAYSDVFSVLDERLPPMTERRPKWWQLWRPRHGLQRRLNELERAIVIAKVSARVVPVMVPTGSLFADKVIVFPYSDWSVYAALTSTMHRVWVDRYTSTMGTNISYSPTDCFDTFPLPPVSSQVESIMQELHDWRATLMVERNEGITVVYGAYHDPTDDRDHVVELRRRHRDLDAAVLAAYGWSDIDLGHDHHETRYGVFFTVSEAARYELLTRLLDLNFRQYAEQTGKPLDLVLKEAANG